MINIINLEHVVWPTFFFFFRSSLSSMEEKRAREKMHQRFLLSSIPQQFFESHLKVMQVSTFLKVQNLFPGAALSFCYGGH